MFHPGRSSSSSLRSRTRRGATAPAAILLAGLAACAVDEADLAGGADEDVEIGSIEAAISKRVCPDNVPAALAPAADQDLSFDLSATGVQRYTCAASGTGFAWTFVEPEADLFRRGCQVGIHYAGPTWEHEDGSLVVAARTAGATVDATAIPWLLLTATAHGEERGKMSKVTSIQRLSTTDGLAPTTPCDADHLGDVADVPYTADYFFYRTRSRHQERNVRCGG
jgi:Protein of unknown function (DUF3455)